MCGILCPIHSNDAVSNSLQYEANRSNIQPISPEAPFLKGQCLHMNKLTLVQFFWVRFQIPHPTDFEWKSWKTSWSWLSGCFYMLLFAAGFLFWAPAMMSENLSHAANFRSTNLKKKQHRNRPQKYEIKTSTSKYIKVLYDYKVS